MRIQSVSSEMPCQAQCEHIAQRVCDCLALILWSARQAFAFMLMNQSVLQEKREASAVAAAHAVQDEWATHVSGPLAAGDAEAAAVRLHHVLKAYPALRECWLSGTSLSALVLPNADGAARALVHDDDVPAQP